MIGRGKANSPLSFPNAPTGAIDDVKTIQAFLKQLVQNKIITPNSNSYYPIHFSPLVTGINTSFGMSCQKFCRYHSTLNVSNTIVVYGVMPDQSQGPCYPCGYQRDAFNNLLFVSSHELIEAITNPYIGFVPYLKYAPNVMGWYDNVDYLEIGDLCHRYSSNQVYTTDSTGKQWCVSQGWSNRRAACYAPP